MYKTIFAMLLLFGSIFAGTTVGVGETVTIGGTTTTTTTDTTTESESTETENEDTSGGVVMTNEEGDSIVVGGENGTVEEVSQGEVVEVGQQGNEKQEMGQQLFQVKKQEQTTILSSNGVSATCNETLKIQNQNVYLEHNGNQHQIKVMPSQIIDEEVENAQFQDMVLEMHSEGPAYRFKVREQRKFFWIFPVDSQTEYIMSAQTGELIEEAGPWWGFLAPPTHSINERLQSAKGTG
ncbi:MAG: hypothetical protein ACLFUZ_00250 [Candidatus Micrarchaeia archaeon]